VTTRSDGGMRKNFGEFEDQTRGPGSVGEREASLTLLHKTGTYKKQHKVKERGNGKNVLEEERCLGGGHPHSKKEKALPP